MRKHWHFQQDKNPIKNFIKKTYAGQVRFWGGDEEQVSSAPAFVADPMYQKTQDYAYPYYTSLLEGTNAYASPIGQPGSKELEDMIGLETRDITNATNENLVRRGMSRSGVAADVIGKNVGDVSTKLRWEDFNRAMTGRLNLLNVGSAGLSGVRNSALTNQSQTNSYALDAYKYDTSRQDQQQQADDAMWAQILSSGIGAAGTIGGMMIGGPAGAFAGGTAANAITGGLGGIQGSNSSLWDINNFWKN
jgi:hypothetical protein